MSDIDDYPLLQPEPDEAPPPPSQEPPPPREPPAPAARRLWIWAGVVIVSVVAVVLAVRPGGAPASSGQSVRIEASDAASATGKSDGAASTPPQAEAAATSAAAGSEHYLYFGLDSAMLDPSAQAALGDIVRQAGSTGPIVIHVRSADLQDTPPQALTLRRVTAVATMLVSYGIDQARIEAGVDEAGVGLVRIAAP